jgi:hypothetical protein
VSISLVSAVDGQRKGWVSVGSTTLAGIDRTSGESGACGINQTLIITMPFRLDKIS